MIRCQHLPGEHPEGREGYSSSQLPAFCRPARAPHVTGYVNPICSYLMKGRRIRIQDAFLSGGDPEGSFKRSSRRFMLKSTAAEPRYRLYCWMNSAGNAAMFHERNCGRRVGHSGRRSLSFLMPYHHPICCTSAILCRAENCRKPYIHPSGLHDPGRRRAAYRTLTLIS